MEQRHALGAPSSRNPSLAAQAVTAGIGAASRQLRILTISNFLLDPGEQSEDIENRSRRVDSHLANSHGDIRLDHTPTRNSGAGRRLLMDKTDLEYEIALVVIVMLSLVIAYLSQIVSATA